MNPARQNIKITLTHIVQDRGDYWAVLLEELGMTAYGRDRDSAIAKAEEIVDDLFESFESEPDPFAACKEFMDAHGVDYSLPQPELPIFPHSSIQPINSVRTSRTLEKQIQHATTN